MRMRMRMLLCITRAHYRHLKFESGSTTGTGDLKRGWVPFRQTIVCLSRYQRCVSISCFRSRFAFACCIQFSFFVPSLPTYSLSSVISLIGTSHLLPPTFPPFPPARFSILSSHDKHDYTLFSSIAFERMRFGRLIPFQILILTFLPIFFLMVPVNLMWMRMLIGWLVYSYIAA